VNEQNNFLIAIVLCLGVLLGWQFFVVEPRLEAERQVLAQQAEAEVEKLAAQPADAAPATPDALPTPNAQAVPQVAGQRQAQPSDFAASPRVKIETEELQGSIALMGARFDDLILLEYVESTDPDAPRQRLLQRSGEAGAWQARHGFVAGSGTAITLPDENSLWRVTEGDVLSENSPVTLSFTTLEGVVLHQRISIDEHFMFTIEQRVENKSADAVTLYPFGQIIRNGLPETSNLFILHEGALGFLGEAGLQEIDYDDLLEDGPVKKQASTGWLGITDKYWATAIIPPQNQEFTARYMGRNAALAEDVTFRTDFLLAGETIASGASYTSSSQFFAGAKVVDVIDAYADQGIERFDLMVDWGWFYFLTKPMFKALQLFYGLIGNYGVAILIVTILIKLAFFPLANRSYETMAKMKKLQPRMTQLRETYKDDRQAQQQELMKLYREEKLNPLAGCLPIFLQIPVFFSLYKVLFVTIDMRHAPFFGWVQDLSAPDPTSLFNLFGLLPYDVPAFLLVGVWPLAMGITMFVQMQMNPPPPDPIQARMFQILPIFFTFILASFPAGLVIYWAWNNLLSVLQQGYIMRRNGVAIELFSNIGLKRKAKSAADQKDS
jgi:YidC/Oxa1 family membrane protein insertase